MSDDARREWRWLCTECGTEGRGDCPDICPECSCADACYETNSHGSDPRPMEAIFRELFSRMGPRH